MCFRPAAANVSVKCPGCGTEIPADKAATIDACPNCGMRKEDIERAQAAPGAPKAPGAPGAPKAPGAPGAPKAPSAPQPPVK